MVLENNSDCKMQHVSLQTLLLLIIADNQKKFLFSFRYILTMIAVLIRRH